MAAGRLFAQRKKVRGSQIDSASEAANGSGCIVYAMPDMHMGHRAGDGVARRRRQSRSQRLPALARGSQRKQSTFEGSGCAAGDARVYIVR